MRNNVTIVHNTVNRNVALKEFFLKVIISEARLAISVDLDIVVLGHVVINDHIDCSVLNHGAS